MLEAGSSSIPCYSLNIWHWKNPLTSVFSSMQYAICIYRKTIKIKTNHVRYCFVTYREMKNRMLIIISMSKPLLIKCAHPCFILTFLMVLWVHSSTTYLMFCDFEQIAQTLYTSCVRWNTEQYLTQKIVLSIHDTINMCKVLRIVPKNT